MAKDDRSLLEGIAADMYGVAFSDLADMSDRDLVELIAGGYVYDEAAIPS